MVIDRPISAGCVVRGPNSNLVIGGGIIRDVQLEPKSGQLGFGVRLETQARATMHGTHIHKASTEGVSLEPSGNTFIGTDLLITDARPDAHGGYGFGISINAARLDLHRARIFRSRRYGIRAVHAGANVTLRDVFIADTKATENPLFTPLTLGIGDKVRLRFSNLRLSGNTGYSMKIEINSDAVGAGLLVDQPRIAAAPDTEGQTIWLFASHLGVIEGSKAKIAGGRFVAGNLMGTAVVGSGTELELTGMRIEGTKPEPNKFSGGIGIDVSQDAALRLRASILRDHHTAALYGSASAKLEVRESVVASTKPAILDSTTKLDATFADGIVATDGCSLDLESSLVFGHQRIAVFVAHEGRAADPGSGVASVNAVRTLFTQSGWGLVLQGGVKAQHASSIAADNSEANIEADGQFALARSPALIEVTK